jgi:hypothetical protein
MMNRYWTYAARYVRGWRASGGVAAAVILVAGIAWLLFVPVADWLARQDAGPAGGPALADARDAARGRLLTLGAGLLAAAALVFTARNFTLSRRTFELSAQGQVTDRYTKAVEQLGSRNLAVRIGGTYALERIARDSERDYPTVIEILAAFIREQSRVSLPSAGQDGDQDIQPLRGDLQAAVTVIARADMTIKENARTAADRCVCWQPGEEWSGRT